MYKYVGFGLLGFLALLIIPVSSATQSDDPSMYGLATVSLKDESGNILIENQMHNEVVDQGTGTMMRKTFSGASIEGSTFGRITGLCVSNASSFSAADSETVTTFNEDNTIISPFEPCLDDVQFIFTDTSVSTGIQAFEAGNAFPDGTTITGIGVCAVDNVGPEGLIDCNVDAIGTSAFLLSLVDITDIAVPGGTQLDVTYTLNLD